MKKFLCALLSAILPLSLWACGKNDSETTAPAFQVGYGKENVMPENITDAYITGDNVTKATGFLDYLAVTCVAVKDANGEIALLYTIDRNLSDEKTFAPMRTTISEATGILEEHIIIAATHCHSAVSFNHSWDGVEKYKEQYQLAMVTAGESAIADLSPSQLFIGSTQAKDLVFVRHYRLTDGTVVSHSGVTPENIHMVVEHPAEKDAEVQIIRFARPAEDKKDVVLVSFNSHPTFNESGSMISADFPAPTRDYIESQGDYLVAYFTGDAGNQIQESRIAEEKHYLDYIAFGKKLGQYVLDAMPTLKQVDTGAVKFLRKTNMVNSNKERLELYAQASEVVELKSKEGIAAADRLAKEYGLYRYLEAGSIVGRAKYPDQLPITLNVLAIGEHLSFAFAPYEMFSEHGSFIRTNTPYDMTFLVSCANGSEGYLPSTAAMEYGCYEGYITRYERGSGEAFAQEFVDMATQLKEGQ